MLAIELLSPGWRGGERERKRWTTFHTIISITIFFYLCYFEEVWKVRLEVFSLESVIEAL